VISFFRNYAVNIPDKNLKTPAFIIYWLLASACGYAQSGPVMYFCEGYRHGKEINISSNFTVGSLTVMVKSPKALGLADVVLEFEKYDTGQSDFVFYKKFDFTLNPEDAYICFSKTANNDLTITEPGFYRVVLLGQRGNVVTNSLVQILPGTKTAKGGKH